MVFEKDKAPPTKKEFMAWYEKQTEWGEDHDCQTISVSSLALQNWFMEMKGTFPPMNGSGLQYWARCDLRRVIMVDGGGSL